jgi:hypothetical protein
MQNVDEGILYGVLDIIITPNEIGDANSDGYFYIQAGSSWLEGSLHDSSYWDVSGELWTQTGYAEVGATWGKSINYFVDVQESVEFVDNNPVTYDVVSELAVGGSANVNQGTHANTNIGILVAWFEVETEN